MFDWTCLALTVVLVHMDGHAIQEKYLETSIMLYMNAFNISFLLPMLA